MNAVLTIQARSDEGRGIVLPKMLLDELRWKDGEEILIKTEKGRIVIERVSNPERKNILELFADFDGDYVPENVDWGRPAGKEVW